MDTAIMLRTSRLTLSSPSHQDAPELLAYYVRNRLHLKPWEPEKSGSFFTLDSMEKRIHDMACAMDAGQALHLVLRDNATGAMVGECGFTNIVRGPFQACHLGFSLDHAAQGRGLMQEALSQAIGHVFLQLGLHRIMANTRTENRRSQALLQRLGFQQEGHARDYLKIDGRWRDHVLHSLINPADRRHFNPDHYLQTEAGRHFTMERNAAAWERLYSELAESLKAAPRELVMVMGVQGSGKSTWVGRRLASPQQCIHVDATFATAQRRARVIGVAQAAGVPVSAVWVRVSLATALARNANRPEDEVIPADAIANVFHLFEPPLLAEGFAAIQILDEAFNLVQEERATAEEDAVFRLQAPDLRGLRRERVRIVRWLREWLPDAEVREVGSTAVPGVIGKQDLDFAVKVTADKFEEARTTLDKHFARNPDQLSDDCIPGYKVASSVDLALQLIVRDSAYDMFDAFLGLLRQDAVLRADYNQLKRQWDGQPMQAYRQAKAAFIARALSLS